MQQANGVRALTLKPDFFTIAKASGWGGSDAAIADHIGTDRTTVWRLRTGRSRAGQHMIAAILAALPDRQFDELFDVDEVA